MTAVSYELCSAWATSADLAGDCAAGCVEDQTLMDDCLAGASLVLYNLTSRKWPGVCTDKIRPAADKGETSDTATLGWSAGAWGYSGVPPMRGYYSWTGMWGVCGCHRTAACGLHWVSEIILPGYPVASVTSVKIDGVTVDPSKYVIQDRRRLVYRPAVGDQRTGWPCCQRVELASDQPDTFEVTYTWGSAPPRIAQMHAATLACEFYKSRTGAEGCRLPQRLQTLTRQGVTMTVLDNFAVFDKGLTGISEIDLWITSDRFGSKSSRASVGVYTPGALAAMRRDQP